ncbi:MAG: septal ring lytic transglycosylase RlpA family protein [Actinomycetota bacterium]
MNRTGRRSARILGAALLCVAAIAGSSLRPAVASDLETLRERAREIADEVTALEHELDKLRGEREAIESEIARLNQQIALLEVAIAQSERDVARTRDLYAERAVEAYKEGPTADLALVLSARDLGELLDAAEVAGNVAERDAGALEDLLVALEARERSQDGIDARKQRLLAAEASNEEVSVTIERTLETRRARLGELHEEIERLERQARAEAARTADPGVAFGELLGGAGASADIPDGYVSTGVAFEGLASWYGPGFEGNITANGEAFDPDLFTAASRDLPFGTRLFVEHEGRGVVVVINDRGPYIEDRILDLSQAAAEAIGLSGVQWVRAEIVVPE